MSEHEPIKVDAAALEGLLSEYRRACVEFGKLNTRIRELQEVRGRVDEAINGMAIRVRELTLGLALGLTPETGGEKENDPRAEWAPFCR